MKALNYLKDKGRFLIAFVRRSAVRMYEVDSVLNGKSYIIEKWTIFGWRQPPISYADDGQFYSKEEADKWFSYLSGDIDKKKLIKQVEHCA
jgi:hypothetical protein